MTQRDVISDLTADAEEFEGLVTGLDEAGWRRPTPAPGWTVAAPGRAPGVHLPPRRHRGQRRRTVRRDGGEGRGELRRRGQRRARGLPRRSRRRCCCRAGAPSATPRSRRWPPCRPTRSCRGWCGRCPRRCSRCAGMMELFAHGQDIADALGVTRERTDRLWHVAWFATLTWDFGYQARGLTPPDTPVPLRAHRAVRRHVGVRPARTPSSGSPARPRTSACWSPAAGTATTSRSPRPAPTPTTGWTSPRPTAVPPARAGGPASSRPERWSWRSAVRSRSTGTTRPTSSRRPAS